MTIEKTETLIVGAGQAGLAMSEHLSNHGEEHIILERSNIAEGWRNRRWDSLVANGPAWHDRFPSMHFGGATAPDDFATKDNVADYFEDYAKFIKAPVRCGVEVISAVKKSGERGFEVETSDGRLEVKNIVAATGPFQVPVVPPIVSETESVQQLHSDAYKNPQQLSKGAVLVVGAGSSGTQIAEEIAKSGKKVYLSIGAHDRPPRSYRGRDFCWWLGVLGKWDATRLEQGKEHVTIAVSGAEGGKTVDFRKLADQGVTLLGMTKAYQNGVMTFKTDLKDNIANGDKSYLALLKEADVYIKHHGLDLPMEEEAHNIGTDPKCLTHPITSLNLSDENITSIIWATGFKLDYNWLKLDIFDEKGVPKHQRGVSTEPGVYFLGLPWQSRRGSSFIWGVWHDAKYIADQIVKLQNYWEYHYKNLKN